MVRHRSRNEWPDFFDFLKRFLPFIFITPPNHIVKINSVPIGHFRCFEWLTVSCVHERFYRTHLHWIRCRNLRVGCSTEHIISLHQHIWLMIFLINFASPAHISHLKLGDFTSNSVHEYLYFSPNASNTILWFFYVPQSQGAAWRHTLFDMQSLSKSRCEEVVIIIITWN